MIELVLRLGLSLGIVLGLFWAIARTGSKRMGGSRSLMKVRSRQSLSRSSSVAVVEVGSRVLVVGVSDGGVALLGIYILVVAQFGSFKVPLVILTPIPLTFIGILGGHWLFGAPFSATSMIGFIALAGIIVRNSILLVDFIRHADSTDRPLTEILIEAGAIRFKPILLTALAAMIGAAVILTDPIFQGLAISLLFGLASSTLLTVLVIPAIYRVLRT